MSFKNEVLPELPKNKVYEAEIQWNEMSIQEDKASFIYTIRNYSLLGKKNKESIHSSSFSMSNNKNIKWHLTLFPNGETENVADFLSLFLAKEFKEPATLTVKYFIAIIAKNNENVTIEETKTFSETNIGWGKKSFFKTDELYKRKENLLPDDTLTIFCSLVAGVTSKSESKTLQIHKSIKDLSVTKIANLCNQLDKFNEFDIYENFYTNNEFTDVTFTIDGKELKAHKCFLAAASPVFASILKKNISNETCVSSIVITDISYEIMQELLHFIYTKKVDNLHNIAHELIFAANKYRIQGLKQKCEISLCENINMDNIMKLAVIADENDSKLLKKLVTDFILENKESLCSNPEFKKTFQLNPNLYQLIFWPILESAKLQNN